MIARIGGHRIEVKDERVRGTNASAPFGQGKVRGGKLGEQPPTTDPSPPGWPKPSDKWNAAYCRFLDLERQAGRIKWFWYEPFSFWLVLPDKSKGERGVRHKVDFMIWYPDGLERRIQMVEVKGYSKRNFRDGITRFKIAREKYPCFDWAIVKRKGNGWEEICL